ncbi:MAG: ABC transporter ATP-binding protein [Clostridia bacterium]|nr:ABC transporter ATP-binding protein [Clostridia bacterium]
MIELRNITKSFRTRSGILPVLTDISLTIRGGEFVLLYGGSGSGKSTLLNILGLMDTPTSGRYYLCGEDTSAMTAARRTKLRGETIGFIFQSFRLIPTMTAYENVELSLGFRGIPKEQRKSAVEKALTDVGLGKRMDHYPADLSGGEQQRVAIARAMILHPAVLLADEPTGNLDRETAAEIMALLRAQNTTVCMVTHDETLSRYADTILRIREGRILTG